MSSEIRLPTIPVFEESSISAVLTPESATAEENRILRLRMLEMLDDWNNGKEPPSVVPGFPQLFSRSSGTSNVPINYPATPFGYPATSAFSAGSPSEPHPRISATDASMNIFTASPCPITAQPATYKPSFDSSSFTFQAPSFSMEPTRFATSTNPLPPQCELAPGQDQNPRIAEQNEIAKRMRSLEQSLKNMQGLSGQKSVSYADLSMVTPLHILRNTATNCGEPAEKKNC